MYGTFKFLHILGVILLLGNVTASAIWKVFANRTGNAAIVAFSQRLVTYTDWSLTLGGVLLTAFGGYGMVIAARMNPWETWLLWGQLLFALSGVIWLVKLIPIQVAQARAVARFGDSAKIEPEYWTLCRQWILWGAIATVPLVIATFLMVTKA